MAVTLVSASALAAEGSGDRGVTTDSEVLGDLPDGAFQALTDTIEPTTMPHLTKKLALPSYYEWKRRISSRYGLDYIFLNTPVFQVGSRQGKVYADNEMDLISQWRVLENEKTQGKFFLWALWVQTFSDLTTGRFARTQSLLTLPNGGATDPDKALVALSALWWEQALWKKRVVYRVGQLYLPSLWGSNKYTSDDRVSFMSSVLHSPEGVNWATTTRSLGATVTWRSESFYVQAGLANSVGKNYPDFAGLGDGRFVYLGEFGFTPLLFDKHEGAYKLTFNYVDGTGSAIDEKSGWGLMVSLRQDVGDTLGLFGRFNRSWDRFVGGSRQTASAGVVFRRPLGWADDRLGIAYQMNDPVDPTLRTEHGMEIYWKLQLTHRIAFTPDLQMYFTPARATDRDITTIVGLRLRIVL